MHSFRHLVIVAIISLASILSLNAQNLNGNPAISPYGTILPLPNAAFQPNKTKSPHKILFTITQGVRSPKEINPSLVHVAKLINLYASAGVPPTDLKIVAVASGDATPLALKNSYYKKEFGVDNPNKPLISKLKSLGVEISVCGQAWNEHHYKSNWLNPDITMSLSAYLTSVDLQEKGYALIPM